MVTRLELPNICVSKHKSCHISTMVYKPLTNNAGKCRIKRKFSDLSNETICDHALDLVNLLKSTDFNIENDFCTCRLVY